MLIPSLLLLHFAADTPEDPPPEPAAAPAPPPIPMSGATAVPVPESPAAPEPAAPARHAQRLRRKNQTDALKRLLSMMVLAALVGTLFYFITPKPDPAPEGNLIRLAHTHLPDVRPAEETDDPAQAAQFIETHFGWRVTVPIIQQTRLEGVALVDLTPTTQLPAFLFADQNGEALVVLALNYAFLDRYQRQGLYLEPTLLESLEQANAFTVEPLEDAEAVVWRDRANIYLALTPGQAEDLVPRIQN